MTAHAILVALGSYGGAFVVGAISSLFPLVSIDLFLIGITLSASRIAIAPIVACAAAGQLVGKLPIYYATRGVLALPGPHRERLERMRVRIARWQRAPHAVLATSAVFGLPPFSIVATAAGALAIRAREFCVVVLAGRALRFAIVVSIAAIASR